MKQTRIGRPPHYTETQVLKGIDLVEQSGGTPTGESVKTAMCDELGVPRGINAQSLDAELHRTDGQCVAVEIKCRAAEQCWRADRR